MWPVFVAVACGLSLRLEGVAFVCGCGVWPVSEAVGCGLCLRL